MIIANRIVTRNSISLRAEQAVAIWTSIDSLLDEQKTLSASGDSAAVAEKSNEFYSSLLNKIKALSDIAVQYKEGTSCPAYEVLEYDMLSACLIVKQRQDGLYSLIHAGLHVDTVFDPTTISGPEVVFLVKKSKTRGEISQILYSELVDGKKTLHDTNVLSSYEEEFPRDQAVIASVAVGDDGRAVVYSGFPVIAEGASQQLPPGAYLQQLGMFATYAPSIARLGSIGAAKSIMLNNVSLYDSVAALEKQVDLLSTLVDSLLENAVKPSWYAAFKAQIMGNSTELFKTPEQLIVSASAIKSKIRHLQSDFLKSIS